jgi:cytochrome bd-type quinol oxidase subunit 2
MKLRHALSIGARLIIGLLIVAAMVFVNVQLGWRSPEHRGPGWFVLPLFLVLALVFGLLIRSFHRMTVFETAVIVSIVFVLECLLFPAVVTDHSRRDRLRRQAVIPTAAKP